MEDNRSGSIGLLAGAVELRGEPDMKDVLLTKREILLAQSKELDTTISLVHQEYSAKLGELQTKKKALEDALHHIEALLRFEGHYLNTSQPNDNTTGGASIAVAETSIVDAAFDLLEELHQPLHYKGMALKLQERNVYIPGKDQAATLLSRINRDNRFKRTTKRGVYGLSTWRMRSVKPRRPKTQKTKRR